MKRLVVGIDPATHSTGFAAFDPDARELVHTALIEADAKASSYVRIRQISDEVAMLLEGIDPDIEVYVFSENTVMRGAGGATFQRCIGAIHSRVPPRMHLGEVQNSTVKKIVGGHGQADKKEVVGGVLRWANASAHNGVTFDIIATHAEAEEWDITDAIAIGIAGWQRTEGERGIS